MDQAYIMHNVVGDVPDPVNEAFAEFLRNKFNVKINCSTDKNAFEIFRRCINKLKDANCTRDNLMQYIIHQQHADESNADRRYIVDAEIFELFEIYAILFDGQAVFDASIEFICTIGAGHYCAIFLAAKKYAPRTYGNVVKMASVIDVDLTLRYLYEFIDFGGEFSLQYFEHIKPNLDANHIDFNYIAGKFIARGIISEMSYGTFLSYCQYLNSEVFSPSARNLNIVVTSIFDNPLVAEFPDLKNAIGNFMAKFSRRYKYYTISKGSSFYCNGDDITALMMRWLWCDPGVQYHVHACLGNYGLPAELINLILTY